MARQASVHAPAASFGSGTVTCGADCDGKDFILIAASEPRVKVSAARCVFSENPSTAWTGAATVLPSAGVELRSCECAWAVAQVPAHSTAAQMLILFIGRLWHDSPGGMVRRLPAFILTQAIPQACFSD